MTVDAEARQEPKSTLQQMDIHNSWIRNFRTSENDRFFGMAFDYIASIFGPPGNAFVVDAGCGSGTKSLQLARRGYRVRGLDFSHAILDEARQAARQEGLADRMEFAQGDLTALSLPSGSVQHALCWGVLMHIPDVAKAVAELARIMAPGGVIIISEANVRSVHAFTLRWLKRLLGKERAEVIRTPAGIESWEKTSTGRLMTRRADMLWLAAEFERHGLKLVERRAGQFSEIYTVLRWKPLRLFVHAFNNFWFRWIRSPGPAFGNILVLKRPQ